MVGALAIGETKTGRETSALHTFFQMDDGSCLAFFEVPNEPFEFREQRDFDLHIALEVEPAALQERLEAGRRAGHEVRGPADHGFVDSIYFRDPNGYVIELTAKKEGHDSALDPTKNEAREILDRWQKEKPTRATATG